MSLRFALLGLTAVVPATGYELTQIFDRTLGHAWHASHSQIYPELRRLEEEGLVEVVSEGPRNSKTFGPTETGRAALREWLVETPPTRRVRDEGALRLFLNETLDPADRLAVMRRELAYVQEHLRMLETLADELDSKPNSGKFRPMVDLGQRMMPQVAGWLEDQIAAAGTQDQDEARADGGDTHIDADR